MMHRVSADNIPVKNVINASGRAESVRVLHRAKLVQFCLCLCLKGSGGKYPNTSIT
jgi:hypothetical protein